MSEHGEHGGTEAYRPAEIRNPFIEQDADGIDYIDRGGYRLAIERQGDPNGEPVFFMHGTPGSRIGTFLSPELLNGLGINLISYDRPGYGRSSRREGRIMTDSAEDIRTTADALGLDKFAILGRSGGGAHALACAALLPNRVSRAVVLGGAAPLHAMGPSWYEGMAESNIRVFGAADDQEAVRDITERALAVRQNPASLLAGLGPELTPSDRHITEESNLRRSLEASYAEAVVQGPDGWVDDVLAVRRPWGFDLSSIRVPVHFRHDPHDRIVPASHAKWMHEKIPGSTIDYMEDSSHFNSEPDLLQRFTHPTDFRK